VPLNNLFMLPAFSHIQVKTAHFYMFFLFSDSTGYFYNCLNLCLILFISENFFGDLEFFLLF
jgi:hypothetical protein